jgi:hypothetical protein
MNVHEDLAAAIEAMPVSEERPPSAIDDFWVVIARGCILGWATELTRDANRARRGLDAARERKGEPTDDQVAAVEEAFWRIRAATEKIDALIAVAFGAKALRPYDSRNKGLRFRPDYETNSGLLRTIGSETALALRAARAALESERATLRRHQLVHSVVPIAKVHDLVPYIVAHHRDGRIIPGGYELSRLTPACWMEGINTAEPADLFQRRLQEVDRSLMKLDELVGALATALPVDARVEVPKFIYLDEDERTISLELPASTRPRRRIDIRFVVDGDPSGPKHLISSESEINVGEELTLDDGVWRVIRTETGARDSEDQIAYCRVAAREG